ncbi:MAG: zinc ABC transporter substrate-binding protein [Pseudomonadota bacterium]
MRTVIFAAALGSLANLSAQAEPRLIATVGMIAEPARVIAGTCASVDTMMGPGIDPHLYQPSAGDVRSLFDADAILYAGHNLEGQLGEVLARLDGRKPVLAVSEAAAPVENLILPEGASYPDPHLWMDAALWSRIASPIATLMATLDPDCSTEAKNAAEDYVTELMALDAWIEASIATIPQTQRVMVTAHDAFAYYGRAYGIEVIGIQGVSTESEAGIADIRQMVDLVVDRQIPAVFIESTINPRTVEAVIAAAAERGHQVTLGGELFSDAMGAEGTVEGTYIGMLHANTVAVIMALGGTPAPLPAALHPWAERWGLSPQ